MLADRLQVLLREMREATFKANRDENSVKLIAVSKTFSASMVREAFGAGLRHFAENYLQEAGLKQNELSDLNLNWHFIGRIQSNKIKQMVGRFHMIHSVDRVSTAESVSRQTSQTENILLQVNLIGEKSKGGFQTDEAVQALAQIEQLPKLRVCGLMFMAPLNIETNEQVKFYSQAHDFFKRMRESARMPQDFKELSMGTSHDFKVAIKFGATMIRVGTALFGSRSS